MKKRIAVLAVVVAGFFLWSGVSLAQTKQPGCDKASTPEKIEGQVVKVDLEQGKVAVRGSDGKTHELQAAKETLQGYKVGDRIEAKLRSAPGCG
jgi:hypothetical protein